MKKAFWTRSWRAEPFGVNFLTDDKDFAVDACPSITVYRYAAL